MVYFLSALAGAFFMSAILIVAICWDHDKIDPSELLLVAGSIIGGFIFLSLAMSIGG